MIKKSKIALYPVFADTLPVVRYLMKYRSDLEIVELLAPSGSCTSGMDACYLDNKETLGKSVQSIYDTEPSKWDDLYLLQHDFLGVSEDAVYKTMYAPIVSIARKNGRIVHEFSPLANASYWNTVLNEAHTRNGSIKRSGVIHRIKTFSVIVGGIIAEADAFEVFLRIYGELKQHLNVVAFSTSKNAEICGTIGIHGILNNRLYSEEQKITVLGEALEREISARKADVMLLQLEEPLMPFSDTQTNGFGIIPYFVSQLITPDFCICSLPFGYADLGFLQGFCEGLEGQLGFGPDYWHLSNTMIDFTTTSMIRDLGALHLPMNAIKSALIQLRKQPDFKNVGNAMIPAQLNEIIDMILQAFYDNNAMSSII